MWTSRGVRCGFNPPATQILSPFANLCICQHIILNEKQVLLWCKVIWLKAWCCWIRVACAATCIWPWFYIQQKARHHLTTFGPSCNIQAGRFGCKPDCGRITDVVKVSVKLEPNFGSLGGVPLNEIFATSGENIQMWVVGFLATWSLLETCHRGLILRNAIQNISSTSADENIVAVDLDRCGWLCRKICVCTGV